MGESGWLPVVMPPSHPPCVDDMGKANQKRRACSEHVVVLEAIEWPWGV
jgi:hypothetical protein